MTWLKRCTMLQVLVWRPLKLETLDAFWLQIQATMMMHDAPTLFKMVNPKIINKSTSLISYEESCLSVPEFYLNVKRFEELTVEWQDGMGTTHRDVFSGFPAIVLQHEMDHLDG